MFVVNDTSVPFWTGVPAPGVLVPPGVGVVPLPPLAGGVGVCVVPFSMTVATMSTDPLAGIVVAVGKIVMTLPEGASRGTLSQATANETRTTAVRRAEAAAKRPRRR
jgi:hypothetical protein